MQFSHRSALIHWLRATRSAIGLAALSLLAATSVRAEIVVGQVAPFSGPQAVTGKAVRAGAQLYFDSVNARGGVKGQQIRFVTRDDAQKPEQTVRLVKELIEKDAPVALLGTIGTSNMEALAADGVLPRSRVTLIGAISGAASVARADGMLVVKASYHDEVARLFSQLSHVGLKRIGLVYQDDGLGKDVLAGVEESAARFGMTLVVRAGYARNTVDVQGPVDQMVKAAPEVVLMGATTAAAIEFIRQYEKAGGRAQLYGMSIIDTDALLKALGSQRARGYAFSTVLPQTSQQKSPVVREYLALQAATPNPELSARSMEGFIAAKALVMSLEKAQRFTPEAVGTALRTATPVDVGGYTLDFSTPKRNGSRYVNFGIFGADGRIVQ
jgi:branched-chain amino acid transport system substrate-binding protein